MTAKKGPKKTTRTKKKTPPPKSWLNHVGNPLVALVFLLVLLASGGYIISQWSLPQPSEPEQPVVRYPVDTEPEQPAEPEVPRVQPPQVAIIMDDLGINRAIAVEAINLDLPVALAIIPGEQHSTEIMELAHRKRRDIMIHIPMEPISYPRNNPGPLGLFSQQSTQQIEQQIQTIIQAVPYAIGGNNHMGSEFTQHADKMRPVLLALKRSGLFFVDSLTSKDSVAYQQARQLGLSCAVRDVFLDNVRELDPILAQFDRLVRLAKRNGSAIAICHPYPQTIEALQRFAADKERFDVELVSIARLVQPQPLPDGSTPQ